MYPEDLKYTKEHEWAKLVDGYIVFGVTNYAQEQLGDIVFIELPKTSAVLTTGSPCGVVESVKAVSELYSPVSGKVIEVNTELTEHPEYINSDPYGNGWMVKVEVSKDSLNGLLSAGDYKLMIGE